MWLTTKVSVWTCPHGCPAVLLLCLLQLAGYYTLCWNVGQGVAVCGIVGVTMGHKATAMR